MNEAARQGGSSPPPSARGRLGASSRKLGDLAATKGITVSQLALAWLLTRGEHVVPIPGTRSVQRIEENAGAADVTLTAADLATIDEILPHGGFGARYSEGNTPVWI
ncbi:aldo/keto reductase [Streptomyces sp. NPDC088253]|uniref:aldo/keto reductase n=1 Tax=Streptomyces sp. NPDC088253 TaxID=3365846 RepID=UPI0037F4D0BE